MARRRAGALAERVRETLARQHRPVTALELAALLRAQGEALHPSIVFRALRTLIAEGAATKVHLARGYVLAGAAETLWLCCSGCGGVTRVPAPDLFAAIGAAARTRGFRPGAIVCEVPGRCAACIGRSG